MSQAQTFLQRGQRESSGEPACFESSSDLRVIWQQSDLSANEPELLTLEFAHLCRGGCQFEAPQHYAGEYGHRPCYKSDVLPALEFALKAGVFYNDAY